MVVERVQETVNPPVIWGQEEPEVRMIATPDWFEHRHRIVARQKRIRRERIQYVVVNAFLSIFLLVLIFGSCWILGGY